jgi:hypothetical protein
VAAAAKALGVRRTSLWHYIARHPEARHVVDEQKESMLDAAETVLQKKVLEGEAWAVCFFLKTQGKSRGYIERAESSAINIDVSQLSDAQLERIAAGEDPIAVLATSRKG